MGRSRSVPGSVKLVVWSDWWIAVYIFPVDHTEYGIPYFWQLPSALSGVRIDDIADAFGHIYGRLAHLFQFFWCLAVAVDYFFAEEFIYTFGKVLISPVEPS